MKGKILDFNNNKNNHNNRGVNLRRQYESAIKSKQDDEFLPPEISNKIPEFYTRQRQTNEYRQRQGQGQRQEQRRRHVQGHRAKRTPYIAILAGVFVLVVILFAIFWESTQVDEPIDAVQEPELEDDSLSNYPPPGRSPVQDILNELYWVDQDFLDINRFSRPGYLIEEINGIVIHFIGNPDTTAQQNRNFFNNLAVTEERHASSNFIICLDGRIVQCVPVDEVAYASHHRNYDTLSIELTHPDETGEFTNETLRAAIRLTAWLSMQFDLTADDIIRHYDIVRSDGSQKRCPLYFVENEDAWAAFKDAVTIAMR